MAGYSGTPLFKKLGIAHWHGVYVENAPPDYFKLLGDFPSGVVFYDDPPTAANIVHVFARDSAEVLGAIARFHDVIWPDGALWISWYKKASKIPTDVTEDLIRDAAIMNGLVDVKVCAVDGVWSALKLVIPVALR